MITVNYSCDRCGTYFDADDLVKVDITTFGDDCIKFDHAFVLCPSCTDKVINLIMKEGADVDTNNPNNS